MLPVRAQVWRPFERYLHSLVSDTSDYSQRSIVFTPLVNLAPETSLMLGASGNWLFTIGQNPQTTRVSNIIPQAFVTLLGQYGVRGGVYLFGPGDRWMLNGQYFVQRFPLFYYGQGPEAERRNEVLLDQFQIHTWATWQWRIAPNWFAGGVATFQSIPRLDIQQAPNGWIRPASVREGSALGLGPALTYDGRANPLNPRRGTYLAARWHLFRPWLGTTARFDSWFVDLRQYLTLSPARPRPHVLALQMEAGNLLGDAPYNLQHQLGGEQMLRGWYLGRYRDRAIAAAQMEYRHNGLPGLPRWGFVTFVAAGAVGPGLRGLSARNTVTSAGSGIRFLVFPRKDILMDLDVGTTRESTYVYLSLGEAF